MGTKRRKEQRREQSIKDKDEALRKTVSQISDPLGEYRLFVGRLRSYGMNTEDYTHIPLNLIDLTATMIASIITGENFFLLYVQPMDDSSDPSLIYPLEVDHAAVNFIRRVLNRTQLSCTSLILGLFFVDRLKSKSNQVYQSPRRRSRRCIYDDEVSYVKKHSFDVSDVDGSGEWSTIPMFLASVIVADKYLSAATYTNEDWADFTCGRFSLNEINQMERKFLSQLNYNLYVTEEMYEAFLSYIEVSLSLSQIYGRNVLSYKDVSILSQSLLPKYINRLNLSLRPVDAMMLMSKVLGAICLCYVAAVAALASMAATCQYASVMIQIQHNYLMSSPSLLSVNYPPFSNFSTINYQSSPKFSYPLNPLVGYEFGNSSTYYSTFSDFPCYLVRDGGHQPYCSF
ncbi:hypothetical protein K7432_004559 [Basidiobolus ranarum]|uniref:Cyclin N-terminal domain-containing protein n=1 Tax=Basidiobolus ranarum TaxID=34480 RepID=A0ABR2WXW5_9FUNG